jgi:predicted Zn-dependent protease
MPSRSTQNQAFTFMASAPCKFVSSPVAVPTFLGIAIYFYVGASCGLAQRAVPASSPNAQTETQSPGESSATLARYEQILRSRPQQGTAFDKLYESKLGSGTLEQFCTDLESQAQQNADGKLWLLLGLVQLRRDLKEEAIESFSKAERLLIADPYPSFYRAKALMSVQRNDAALAAWQSTLDRKPIQTLVLEILKDAARTTTLSGTPKGLETIWDSIERLYPTNTQVLKLLADSMMAHKSPLLAQKIYERLIAQTKEPAARLELQIQLAQARMESGDYATAAAELKRLLKQVNPDSWLHDSLLTKIESIYTASKDSAGLNEFYESRLRDHPKDVALRLRFAKRLMQESRTDEAEEQIQQARQLAPTRPEPLEALADLNINLGNMAGAVTAMQQLNTLQPDNADYIARWGEYVLRDNSTDLTARQLESFQIWKRLLTGHESDPSAYIRLAELLHKAAMTDEAISHYRQAVAVAAPDRQLEYQESFADFLVRLNRRGEALQILRDLATSSQTNPTDLSRISELMLTYDFKEAALDAMKQACDLQPTSSRLLKLAELLYELNRYGEAIQRLEQASTMVEQIDEAVTVWNALVRTHPRMGSLEERIRQLQDLIDDFPQASSAQWQQLALMHEARRDFSAAAASTEKLLELDPNSILALHLSVRMESRAGRWGRQIASLQRLIQVDPKNQSNYLKSIAHTQLALGQSSEALSTANSILQLAQLTPRDYLTLANLYREARHPERAMEALKLCVERFPQDRQSLVALATENLQQNHWSDASDLGWRALELSRTELEVREVLSSLRSILKATNNSSPTPMPSLVGQLDDWGRMKNRQVDIALWACWAAESSTEADEAMVIVERIITGDVENTKLLQAALQLAELHKNNRAARDYLLRLNQITPEAGYQLKLGTLMAEQGDAVAASNYWRSATSEARNTGNVLNHITHLIDTRSPHLATQLIEIALEHAPNNWELLTLGIIANQANREGARATEFASKLLALDLPPTTPSVYLRPKSAHEDSSKLDTVELPAEDSPGPKEDAIDRLAWIERAAPWQAVFNQQEVDNSGFRSSLGNPGSANSSLMRLQALQRGATIRSLPKQDLRIKIFADARAIAVLAKFGKVNAPGGSARSPLLEHMQHALQTQSPQSLWDCILALRPAIARSNIYDSSGEISMQEPHLQRAYFQAIELLSEQGDPDALEMATAELSNKRQLQIVMARKYNNPPPAMPVAELEQLQRLVSLAYQQHRQPALMSCAILAAELRAVGKNAESSEVLQRSLGNSTSSVLVARVAQECLRIDREVAQSVALRAFELELLSDVVDTTVSSALVAIFDAAMREPTNLSALHDFFDQVIGLQAIHLKSAPVTHFTFDRRSALPYAVKYNAAPFQPTSGTFPLSSPFVSNSLMTLLRFIRMSDNAEAQATLIQWLEQVQEPADSASAVRLVCNAYWRWWQADSVGAIDRLRKAAESSSATELLHLMTAHILLAAQRANEAADELRLLTPQNAGQRRDQELAFFTVAKALNDADAIIASAGKLADMPLDDLPDNVVSEVMRALEPNN